MLIFIQLKKKILNEPLYQCPCGSALDFQSLHSHSAKIKARKVKLMTIKALKLDRCRFYLIMHST